MTAAVVPGLELRAEKVSVSFGGLQALKAVDLVARPRTVTSLIGPNGAGKTTLFSVISGFIKPDSGTVTYGAELMTGRSPHDVVHAGIARTFQDLRLFQRMTVLENVLVAMQDATDGLRHGLFSSKFLRPAAIQRAREITHLLDIEQYADEVAANLSYGLQKRLAISRALATGAQVLLLDEPTAGLQPSMVTQLLDIIRNLVADGKTVVLVDHNMEAVMDTSDWVVVLDHGSKIAEGLPKDVRNNDKVLSVYLGVA